MTMIYPIRAIEDAAHRAFVAERLKGLKDALRSEIHGGTDERSLRLATWNLMHFGDGGGYDRTTESMLYIAEIIDHFDLVAVQEVNADLSKFETLVEKHLGYDWDYIVTDATEGGPGNHERLAFLYRKAKVHFRKEAGEIVLPEGQEVAAPDADGKNVGRTVQFARTPFAVSFRSAWLRFKLCTVHIFYGKAQESSPEMAQRREEIAKIAQFLADRQEQEAKTLIARAKAQKWERPEEGAWESNMILLGDFNIVSPEHRTMQALTEAGFCTPTALQTTDLGSNHAYDQIAFKAGHPGFKVLHSGVFDMLAHVYRDDDAGHYVDHVKPASFEKNSKGKTRDRDQQIDYFKTYYRRHQMSDHKLLWCEICVDYADDYLDHVIGKAAP